MTSLIDAITGADSGAGKEFANTVGQQPDQKSGAQPHRLDLSA